jgi:Caspase domain
MAKRALIIRSDYDRLASFANSAACIGQTLRSRGFELERCEGPEASRDGILRAYDELIGRTTTGDAIVLYYVGHGGLTTNRTYSPDLPRYIQHLCPTDFGETTDDDFRGISTFELSLRLAALTRRTRNVTVILECCFAAQLARGDQPPGAAGVRPKLTRVGLTSHLRAVRDRARGFDQLELTGNLDAVRVAAAGQIESAYPLPLPSAGALHAIGIELPERGERGAIGAMTLCLVEILAEIGEARVSWRSIAAALRARLHVQRPEIEGPVDRVPFSLATVDAATFAVRDDDDGDGVLVEAGRLLGVSVGDVYGVMPAGSTQIDPARLVAELTIDEVSPVHSRARRIRWCAGASELPAHAVAIARSLAFERYPVRVSAGDAARPAIEVALQTSRRVRAATPEDRDVPAELRVHGAALEIRDELGLLFPPARYPDRLQDAVRDLENLATERHLRALSEDAGLAPADVSVELLVVGDGGTRSLADHGEALGLGDRLALRLENRTSEPVFANVFNIGLRRRIALLSATDASGIRLPPDAPVYAGATIDGGLAGFQLFWPEALPRDRPRVDTVMVVITQDPADLRVLESVEHLARSPGRSTSLQALLGQLARGGSRSVDDAGAEPPAAFALCWRDYRLFPLHGSLDIGVPQVDASPTGSGPASGGAATMQIRLAALAADPGTRVDVLVCARSAAAPYCATTVIGCAPRDLVVWIGELRGPADVYVWTSTDRGDRRPLADFMTHGPIAEPVTVLRAPDHDPRSALAPGASLQLAAIARAALLGIEGATASEVVTAFRGSFGADEHDDPAGQRYTTAAASFSIAIDRLDT